MPRNLHRALLESFPRDAAIARRRAAHVRRHRAIGDENLAHAVQHVLFVVCMNEDAPALGEHTLGALDTLQRQLGFAPRAFAAQRSDAVGDVFGQCSEK
jgi:peptidoglycan/xylan/chitin deacetylase (PgdA/CDA1 family)